MNDSIDKTPSRRSASLEDMLRTEARRIPVPDQPRLISQVMQHVRATPRRTVIDGSDRNNNRLPWLTATATAAVVVTVVITIVITIMVTTDVVDSPAPTTPRQANILRVVESRVDPILASREQDLAGELQRIRADLDSVGRMVTLELEFDTG